jgi:hypothetical protein
VSCEIARASRSVYKGRDTRLDRTVAIKILPEALAADPQFRERFVIHRRAELVGGNEAARGGEIGNVDEEDSPH